MASSSPLLLGRAFAWEFFWVLVGCLSSVAVQLDHQTCPPLPLPEAARVAPSLANDCAERACSDGQCALPPTAVSGGENRKPAAKNCGLAGVGGGGQEGVLLPCVPGSIAHLLLLLLSITLNNLLLQVCKHSSGPFRRARVPFVVKVDVHQSKKIMKSLQHTVTISTTST